MMNNSLPCQAAKHGKLSVLGSSKDLNTATCRIRSCGCTSYLAAIHEFEKQRMCTFFSISLSQAVPSSPSIQLSLYLHSPSKQINETASNLSAFPIRLGTGALRHPACHTSGLHIARQVKPHVVNMAVHPLAVRECAWIPSEIDLNLSQRGLHFSSRRVCFPFQSVFLLLLWRGISIF